MKENKAIVLPAATLGKDSRPSHLFRGAIQSVCVSIIRHSKNRTEALFLSEGSFSISIPLMQPQALNNCWLLKSFCACPNRSVCVEYQLHLQWLGLRKTKRVNEGMSYKGKTSQGSCPLEHRPMSRMRSTNIVGNCVSRKCTNALIDEQATCQWCSLRDIQKLAVPILHVGWHEELEWKEWKRME